MKAARRQIFIVMAFLKSLSALGQPLPSPAAAGTGTIEPEVTGIGARVSIAGERFIAIHRQSRNQTIGPIVHYFHRPLFILKTTTDPTPGFPPIVIGTPREIGAKTYLTFRLILTTPQFEEDARAFVIDHDPELKSPSSVISSNDIKVDVWPIITLNVRIIEPLTGAVLGEWVSPSLEAAGSIITFSIGLDPANLDLFKKYAGSGDLQFAFSYTFRNVRQQYAAAMSTASRQVNQALQQAVSASNISPDTPVFQSQVNELRTQLSTRLATQISASSAELIPLVQSQLVDHYITSQVTNIDSIQDKGLSDAIYGYLKPLLQTMVNKRTQENSTTNTREQGTTVKLKANPFGTPGGDFEMDQTDKDTITTKAGVTLEFSQTDQAYEPREIRVYKLSNITDQDTVQIVSQAFISQGGDSSFQTDTPIRSDFSDARVGSFNAGESPKDFAGVLPGMAFCYLGDQIPRGFVELDGKTKWPDASWVPEQLRGIPMPDAQDFLIGITRKTEETGRLTAGGRLDLGPIQIPAAGLTLNMANTGHFTIVSPISPHAPAMYPTVQVRIPSDANPYGGLEIVLANEIVGTAIQGTATAKVPVISLDSVASMPRRVGCRLIVRQ